MENKENLTPQTEDTPLEPTAEEDTPKVDVVKGIELLEQKLIDSEKSLESATKELESNKEIFQRTLAEYDNYRKRTAKEKGESYSNGMTNAVMAILPILDTLEMALDAPCTDDAYKKGIEMTMTTAKNALSKLGVEEIEALDKPFDPNLHAAVMQETIDGKEAGIVTKQLQKGYKMGEKVIRHSTVAVSC